MKCRHGVPIYIWCDDCDRQDTGWEPEWQRAEDRRRWGRAAAACLIGAVALVVIAAWWTR